MSNNVEKMGAKLVVEGADAFASNINNAKNTMVALGTAAKKSITELGKSSSAIKNYNANMKSLESQMNGTKQKLTDLNSKYADLKKSTGDLPNAIAKVSDKYREKQKALKETEQAMKNQQKVVDELAKTHKKSSSEYKNANSELKQLKSEYSSGKKEVKSLEQEIKTLNSSLEKHEKELERLPNKISQVEASYDKLGLQMQKTHQEFRNNGGRFADAADRFTNAGNKLNNVGDKMIRWGAGITLATAGIGRGMKYAADEAVRFESDFAGVMKTVDGTPEEFNKLREEFLKMSTEIPVTANELAKIGETAGQLGIKKENIKDFTRVMADMSVATNLSSEEAATALSQFMAVMNTSQDKVSNLGSAIVSLGNNFATSESKIVEMSQRLAPMGQLVNMSEADVLGLAAAMSTVGIEAEAGGTAMTQVMNKMQNAIHSGGVPLANFAKAARVSAAEFSEAFRNRPVEALQLVLRGLKQTKEEGGNVNFVLEELGVKGVRESLAMNALAGALDGDKGLAKALEIANKGFEENNALSKEANMRYKTTASQVQIAKNEINKMAIEIGAELLPKIAEFLKGAKPFIKSLGDLALKFSRLSTSTQMFIVGLGPGMILLGKFTNLIASASKGLGGFIRWLGKISTAKAVGDLAKFGGAAATASKSVSGLGKTAASAGASAPLLSNPYVLAGGAILAAFAGIGYKIYRELTKDSRNHETSVAVTKGKYEEWFNAIKKGAEISAASVDFLSGKVKSNSEIVKEEMEKIQKINTEATEKLDESFESLYRKGEHRKGLKEKLKNDFMFSDNDIAEIESKTKNVAVMLSNSLGEITNNYVGHGKVTAEYASAQIENIKNISSEILTSFNAREEAELASIEKMKTNGTLLDGEYEKRVESVKKSYSNISTEVEKAQNEISDILRKASKEHRGLTEEEVKKIGEAYEKMSELAGKSITSNVDAQKELTNAIKDTVTEAQLSALVQNGILSESDKTRISLLTDHKQKQEELNKALDKFADTNISAKIDVKYNGDNVVLTFANDMERITNLPNIVKTIRLAEEQGRTIEMTKADFEFLEKMGISPKNVKIIDGVTGPLESIITGINNYTNTPTPPPKSIMLEDQFTIPMDNILGKAHEYNSTEIPTKPITATDNASDPIIAATSNLTTFNQTTPDNKILNADGNVSPFSQEAKRNLDNLINTKPDTKHLEAVDNVSGKANAATNSINNIPARKTSVIDIITNHVSNFFKNVFGQHAEGGNIDQYATGGNIGTTQWLKSGYQGIVGEAGPELFTVNKNGVNITPLSTREKIQGISGKLQQEGGDNININFNLNGLTVREEADIDRLTDSIEKKLIRSIKEVKRGGGNVYSL